VGGVEGDWNCLTNFSRTIDECGHDYLDKLQGRPRQNGIILMHDRLEKAVGSGRSLRLTRWLVQHLPRPEYLFVPLDAIPGPFFKSPIVTLWSAEFSDAAGWGQSASYFATVHLADVNGDNRPIG